MAKPQTEAEPTYRSSAEATSVSRTTTLTRPLPGEGRELQRSPPSSRTPRFRALRDHQLRGAAARRISTVLRGRAVVSTTALPRAPACGVPESVTVHPPVG